MPTYVYACKSCEHQFEKYQSFSEESLITCPECSQDALRKVFNSVGIVFKGSGFYSTDSSSKSSTQASTNETSASDSSSSSSTGDASGKVAAPAATGSSSASTSSTTSTPAA